MLQMKLNLVLLCSLIVVTSTKTSNKWKLNPVSRKIESTDTHDVHYLKRNGATHNFDITSEIYKQDESFYIIVASEQFQSKDGTWLRKSPPISYDSLQNIYANSVLQNFTAFDVNKPLKSFIDIDNDETLNCGQPANYTQYDYIINMGTLSKRNNTKFLPEPEVAYFFLRHHDKEAYKNFNLDALETRLKRAKRDNPLSAKVYHHIGNYWRIKGDATEAVKCFRRALDIAPTESEVMFNLGKVLFNLQYLDDAIHIIRRSIEFQSPTQTVWRQYFLLGEILRAYGDNRGSMHYYRLALQLNPTHELLVKTVNNFSNKSSITIHAYTILIIVTLVIIVLILMMLSSAMGKREFAGSGNSSLGLNSRGNQRTTIRSLKGFSSTRNNRSRRF